MLTVKTSLVDFSVMCAGVKQYVRLVFRYVNAYTAYGILKTGE